MSTPAMSMARLTDDPTENFESAELIPCPDSFNPSRATGDPCVSLVEDGVFGLVPIDQYHLLPVFNPGYSWILVSYGCSKGKSMGLSLTTGDLSHNQSLAKGRYPNPCK